MKKAESRISGAAAHSAAGMALVSRTFRAV